MSLSLPPAPTLQLPKMTHEASRGSGIPCVFYSLAFNLGLARMEGVHVQGNSLGEIPLKQWLLSPWMTATDTSVCAVHALYSWQFVRCCSTELVPVCAFWWKKHEFQFRSSGFPELCGFVLNSSFLTHVVDSSFWLNICVLSPKLVC